MERAIAIRRKAHLCSLYGIMWAIDSIKDCLSGIGNQVDVIGCSILNPRVCFGPFTSQTNLMYAVFQEEASGNSIMQLTITIVSMIRVADMINALLIDKL